MDQSDSTARRRDEPSTGSPAATDPWVIADLPVGLLRVRFDGTVIDANAELRTLLGPLTPGGSGLRLFDHPAHRVAIIAATLARPEQWVFHTATRFGPTGKALLSWARTRLDEFGRPAHNDVLILDPDRLGLVPAESEVHPERSERRFLFRVIDGLTDDVAVLRADGSPGFVNHALRARLPVAARQRLRLDDVLEALAPRHGEALRPHVERLLRPGDGRDGFDCELLLAVDESGNTAPAPERRMVATHRRRWYRYRGYRCGDGPTAGVVVMRDDRTGALPDERRRRAAQAEALVLSHDLDDTAVLRIGIPRGRLIDAGPGAAPVLRYASKGELQAAAATWFDLLTQESAPGARMLLMQMAGGEIRSFRRDLQHKTADGQPVWLEVRASVVCDPDGKPIEAVLAARDVDARKAGEQRLTTERNFAVQLAGVEDIAEAARISVEAACELSGFDGGCFFRRGAGPDDQGDTGYHLVYGRGFGAQFRAATAHLPGIPGWKDGYTGAELSFAGLFRTIREATIREVALTEGMKRFLVVPVRPDPRRPPSGAIGLFAHDERPPTPVERHNAETIGALVGGTMARLQATEALRDGEQRMAAVLSASPDLLLVLDSRLRVLEVFTSRDDLLIVPKVALIGADLREILPPTPGRQLVEVTQRALDTNTRQEIDYSLPVPAGTRDFVATIVPFQRGAGRMALTVVRDVTRLRSVENRLRAADQHLHLIGTHSSDLITIHDASGRFIHASSGKLGFDAAAMLGKKSPYKVFVDDEQAVTDAFAEVSAGAETRTVQFRSGEDPQRWFESVLNAVRSGRGGPVESVVVVTRDITAQRRSEKLLRRAKEEAERASLAKSRFVAGVSHDLRTPLNAIIGMGELLLTTPGLPEPHRDFANVIADSARGLLSTVSGLIDYAQLDVGSLPLRREPFEICRMLDDAVRLVAPAAADKGLELVVRQTGMMPASAIGDAARLRQVVTHLLANAVKFTAAGTVQLVVSVEPDQLPRPGCFDLQIRVSDTGPGIPPGAEERVFEPFTRGSDGDAPPAGGGTGIGLSIVRETISALGGRITAGQAPGGGAEFDLRLQLPAADEPAESLGVPGEFGVLTGRHVMVVHAPGPARDALVESLIALGAADVCTADDAETALREMAARTFGFALVDENLPHGGAARIGVVAHRDHPRLRTILLGDVGTTTAFAQRQAARHRLGYRIVVPRPASPLRLVRAVVASGEPAASEPTPPAQATAPATPTDKRSGPGPRFAARVLLAEDNVLNQRVATAMLQRLGCDVEVVGDGETAVRRVETGIFDLVLMDRRMPVLDGTAATRRIRAAEEASGRARVPIVALTADAQPQSRTACLSSGMDDYVTKPVEMRDLAVMLAMHAPHTRIAQRLPKPGRDARTGPMTVLVVGAGDAAYHVVEEVRDAVGEAGSAALRVVVAATPFEVGRAVGHDRPRWVALVDGDSTAAATAAELGSAHGARAVVVLVVPDRRSPGSIRSVPVRLTATEFGHLVATDVAAALADAEREAPPRRTPAPSAEPPKPAAADPPAPRPAPARPVYDRAAALRYSFGDEELLRDALTAFGETLRRDAPIFDDPAADRTVFRDVAHRIKGGAATVGFRALATAAEAAQFALDGGDVSEEQLHHLARRIRAEIGRAERLLDQEPGNPTGE
jgi:PAS domain S-box-containing protein